MAVVVRRNGHAKQPVQIVALDGNARRHADEGTRDGHHHGGGVSGGAEVHDLDVHAGAVSGRVVVVVGVVVVGIITVAVVGISRIVILVVTGIGGSTIPSTSCTAEQSPVEIASGPPRPRKRPRRHHFHFHFHFSLSIDDGTSVVVVVVIIGSPIKIDLTETKTRPDVVVKVAVPLEGGASTRPPSISIISRSRRDVPGRMPRRRRRGGGRRGGEGSEMGRSSGRRGSGATTATFGATTLEGGTSEIGWWDGCGGRGEGGVDGRGCGFVVAVFVFGGAFLCALTMVIAVVGGAVVVGGGGEAAEQVSGTASASSSGVVAVAASEAGHGSRTFTMSSA